MNTLNALMSDVGMVAHYAYLPTGHLRRTLFGDWWFTHGCSELGYKKHPPGAFDTSGVEYYTTSIRAVSRLETLSPPGKGSPAIARCGAFCCLSNVLSLAQIEESGNPLSSVLCQLWGGFAPRTRITECHFCPSKRHR
jgi:hypothetical protein